MSILIRTVEKYQISTFRTTYINLYIIGPSAGDITRNDTFQLKMDYYCNG